MLGRNLKPVLGKQVICNIAAIQEPWSLHSWSSRFPPGKIRVFALQGQQSNPINSTISLQRIPNTAPNCLLKRSNVLPDHRHRLLLCPRHERPSHRRAAEKGDELPPPHSITLSARDSRPGGTSRPSVRAVLRLIISSNLVGSWTGSSAG